MLGGLPSGWRNNPSVPQRADFGDDLVVEYVLSRARRARLAAGRGRASSRRRACTARRADEVDLEVAGVRRRYRVRSGAGGAVFVNTDEGQLDLTEAPRFPEAAHAAQPGRWSRRCPAAWSA